MFDRNAFEFEKSRNISAARNDSKLKERGLEFLIHADKYNYGYYWTWMGLPIIQMPEDIVLTQELLWETKPDVVIEAGIAWGGSLAMYASFLQLLGSGRVFGIDVTIPRHNRDAIMGIPVANRITLIEGSSTDSVVFQSIADQIPPDSNILLILDSNHTHAHVLEELRIWSPLLKRGNYIVVSDTVVEEIPKQEHRVRPWAPGNNPMTAVREFLSINANFTSNNKYSNRAFSSFNPSGYLECIS